MIISSASSFLGISFVKFFRYGSPEDFLIQELQQLLRFVLIGGKGYFAVLDVNSNVIAVGSSSNFFRRKLV